MKFLPYQLPNLTSLPKKALTSISVWWSGVSSKKKTKIMMKALVKLKMWQKKKEKIIFFSTVESRPC